MPPVTSNGIRLGMTSAELAAACKSTPQWKADRCEANQAFDSFDMLYRFSGELAGPLWEELDKLVAPVMHDSDARLRVHAIGGPQPCAQAAFDRKTIVECRYRFDYGGVDVELEVVGEEIARFTATYRDSRMNEQVIYGLGQCPM